jgi:hypothetical protein
VERKSKKERKIEMDAGRWRRDGKVWGEGGVEIWFMVRKKKLKW